LKPILFLPPTFLLFFFEQYYKYNPPKMNMTLWSPSDWLTMEPWEDYRRGWNQWNGPISTAQIWSPAFDIKETDKEVVIHADLPGMKKEDIKIEMEDGFLTISGERKEEKKEQNEKVIRIERTCGKFSRSTPVPKMLREKDIQARFEDGVLEVTFPRLEEEAPRKSKRFRVN
jgi:HSP20 family protein